jgi:predicted glycoside hydrolase/deacetylase ChbG (UPF0249 family)
MVNEILLNKLGYDNTDKVVIFHIDDVGFSHSANLASFECLDYGIASCGSLIVPSSWFLEAVSICKKNPKYDIGVHLTLTCEYDLYRWRALSSVDPKSGLLDHEGALWRTTEEAVNNVSVKAAESEMRAQIQTAVNCGVNITHIDSHMGSVMTPKYLPTYLKLAEEYKVAPFIPRPTKEQLIEVGLGDQIDIYDRLFSQFEEKGVPVLDHMIIQTLEGDGSKDKIDFYCKLIESIKPGVTHFLFHAAKMSSELLAIAPDAHLRNQDYEAFTHPRLKGCVEANNLHIIGYKEIQEALNKK